MISYDAGDSRCRHCASVSTSFGTGRTPRSRPSSPNISNCTLPGFPIGVFSAANNRGTSTPAPTASDGAAGQAGAKETTAIHCESFIKT